MQSSPPARRRLQLEALEDRATPAAGALDPTFGGTGIVHVPWPTSNNFPHAGAEQVLVQPDGKVVLIGPVPGTSDIRPDNYDFGVTRLNPDGSLDKTFG